MNRKLTREVIETAKSQYLYHYDKAKKWLSIGNIATELIRRINKRKMGR